MKPVAIKIEHLTKIYKGELGQKDILGLENLNLDIHQGEIFAFLGPNGAGKTTTIKLLTRLIFPTQGKIWIFGQRNNLRVSMESVGYLPEQPSIYGYLTGQEFLNFIAHIFGLDSETSHQRKSELLNRVGLGDRWDQKIRSYSRGMAQRLGLAQALMNDPNLLILDEPMANLDPIGRKDFRDLILELKDQGKTIFFSSHILSDAEMIADRVGILNEGKLVKVGRLDDLVDTQVTSIEVTFVVDSSKLNQIEIDHEDLIVQGQKVMVRLKREEDVPGFLRHVDHLQGRVISVVPQRISLEAYFMTKVAR